MIVIHPDGKVDERKYNGDINEIYEAIHAGLFDIVHVGKGIDLFVDDEGLFREENFKNGRPRGNGNTIDLNDEQVRYIKDALNIK